MARPVTISDEQILEAARIVFVRDGINATTSDIARQAGVSEGSIFNRFPNKEALLLAAVKVPSFPAWVGAMDSMLGAGELHQNLIDIAWEMVTFAQKRFPLLIAFRGSKIEQAAEPDGEEPPAVRDRRRLAGYLQKEVEAGRLRPCDTEAIAQMLFGACLNFVMDRVNRQQADIREELESFVRGLIQAIWPGIAPDRKPPGQGPTPQARHPGQ